MGDRRTRSEITRSIEFQAPLQRPWLGVAAAEAKRVKHAHEELILRDALGRLSLDHSEVRFPGTPPSAPVHEHAEHVCEVGPSPHLHVELLDGLLRQLATLRFGGVGEGDGHFLKRANHSNPTVSKGTTWVQVRGLLGDHGPITSAGSQVQRAHGSIKKWAAIAHAIRVHALHATTQRTARGASLRGRDHSLSRGFFCGGNAIA